ncbi:hypothetical protein [Pseudorhodobacter antarcticus]|jgi:selenocysteine lyase/cysteine desulfurase|uniref:hypothetical protein n=1 Tax=Pseudorhodobacter antarcticus TaxID=1077947 RepID=UPI0009444D0C|nr:hypothetical protein [Pseudorhodobacter antarcticus]
MIDIDKIRSDFPILSRQVNGKPLVYLDNGASSQKPQVVKCRMLRRGRTAAMRSTLRLQSIAKHPFEPTANI